LKEREMSVQTNTKLADVVRDRLRLAIEACGVMPDRITVHAHDGCIELKGAVPSWKDHEMLERIALSTPGVSKVDNQLALLVKARLAEPVG
jgi:osmotically-inducible protein OsmY